VRELDDVDDVVTSATNAGNAAGMASTVYRRSARLGRVRQSPAQLILTHPSIVTLLVPQAGCSLDNEVVKRRV